MFESDGKKQLKNKYNKMSGIAGKDSKFKIPGKAEQSQSVYGELKLS